MKSVFDFVKKKIPKLSSTELIALNSGNTSLDRNILKGEFIFPNKHKINYKFPKNHLDYLLNNFDSSQIYPNNNNNKWLKYLSYNKYFSFIIDEKYDGIKLSTNELSSILTKITSVDPALGVVTMVPNSLGPGELLTHYGTQQQKDHYLPKLSNGEFIPCFGLTGPNNGSDATGNIDTGKLILENGKKFIEIDINKRYITLAPVANLIGVAFKLEDPYDLLDNGTPGVTLALVEKDTCGLLQNTYHNPLNAGFPNGTLKGSLKIPLEQIIGGESQAGNGWKMLMDCLSAGRGISLPATANASSKVASFGLFHYIKIRDQFKMPIGKMEAIQDKFVEMVYHTWIIQSSIDLTNDILDSGSSPAVISAIMKQQTTERARHVLNHAMDIHAGSSICLGYSNFLEKFYRSAPIGVTVEGSNTLTRSLIIFGQGLNKSHPHIFPILQSVLDNNLQDFNKHFKNILSHSLLLYIQSFAFNKGLEQQIIDFACLTNFVALKGGLLKKEQMLSSAMADIFSNLYLAIGVKYYHKHYDASSKLTNYIIDRLVNENQTLINQVIDNLHMEKYLLLHMKKKVTSPSFKQKREIFNEIMENPLILENIKKDIHIRDVLLDMENALKLDPTSPEYLELKNKIINVGEFNIQSL